MRDRFKASRARQIIASATTVTAVLATSLMGGTAFGQHTASQNASSAYRHFPVPGHINVSLLSQGAKAWWQGPQFSGAGAPNAAQPSVNFGTNVDANDPSRDLAAGQSETAIGVDGRKVLVAWNDATAFLKAEDSTKRRASLTGVGFSADGGRSFTDLLGLPNDNNNQQWSGDPSVVALGDGTHFIVSSLYVPSFNARCRPKKGVHFEVAVSVATVTGPSTVSFTKPIVAADGGDLCASTPDNAFLDKEFLSYDPVTRTLATSFTRVFLNFSRSGAGQIEVVRASVPADPTTLSKNAFSAPIVVWPEESTFDNTGSYVAVAPGGDTYVAWERNINSNLPFNFPSSGDPYVYIHAARIPAGASGPDVGGTASPRVVTLGQDNASKKGGVKSLDAVTIPGYNRGTGQDFPRIAVDAPLGKIVIVWNDASLHPLGDIWMRALDLALDVPAKSNIRKINDDNSFALHFLPAVSVRSDGTIATSWYDRRLSGADSAVTDYFGEIRATPSADAFDFRVTISPTDWTNTSSVLVPNFGDYTDNASTGTTTYFTWSDGRIGVPQPFVDSR